MIMQMAYVVQDIHAAMRAWASCMKVGPWVLQRHLIASHPVYRGQEIATDVAIALSFSGSLNIELIQPNDTNPSVYREVIDTKGYGFHHWGIASNCIEADVKRCQQNGMDLVYRAGMPVGGDVIFMDSHGAMPGFIELIEMSPALELALSRLRHATSCWDGVNPVLVTV